VYFTYRPSQACVFLLTALLSAQPLVASDLRYSLGLEAGQVSLSTSEPNEIDKDGQSFGAMVSAFTILNSVIWGLGAGFSSANLEGDGSSRGVKQDLGLDLFFLDLRYLYLISENLAFGPSFRGYFGKGAKHGVTENDDIDFMLSPGLALQYSWSEQELSPSLALSYYRDVNISHRDVTHILLSLSISTHFAADSRPESPRAAPSVESITTSSDEEMKAQEAASVAAAVAAPTPNSTPDNDIPVVAQGSSIDVVSASESPAVATNPHSLKAIVLAIDPNSGKLTADGEKDLKTIAKILQDSDGVWTKLTVSGHSDRNGVPALNKQLSRQRAEAVCESLVLQSLPKEKMSCMGLGSEQPLPSLPKRARAQRRVEILIEAKDPKAGESMEQALTQALAQ
jgi:outer membrane protein OmpA-like peptidoglycan-associated protein